MLEDKWLVCKLYDFLRLKWYIKTKKVYKLSSSVFKLVPILNSTLGSSKQLCKIKKDLKAYVLSKKKKKARLEGRGSDKGVKFKEIIEVLK